MELLYVLLVILLMTRVAAEVAVRLDQPPMTGELVVGILLGIVVHHYESTFTIFAGLGDDKVFRAITDLAVFFLMLSAGIEMRPKDLTSGSMQTLTVASFGMIVPLAMGIGLGIYFLPESDYHLAQVMFIGTALAVTAVPVAIKALQELNLLQSQSGKLIVSAALVDDILSLILLAVLTGLVETGTVPGVVGIAEILGRVAVFFAVTVGVGFFILPRILRVARKWWIDELEFSSLIIVALGFSVFAEYMHLHFILGAFVAGLFFQRREIDNAVYDDVEKNFSAITSGFLAPLFFVSIGLHLDISAVTSVPLFLTLLIAAAFIGKLAGAGLPARAWGMTWRESAVVGTGMSARGAVELIIADIALRAGLFSKPEPVPTIVANLFSAVVIMAVITTLATPIGIRLLNRSATETNPAETDDDG